MVCYLMAIFRLLKESGCFDWFDCLLVFSRIKIPCLFNFALGIFSTKIPSISILTLISMHVFLWSSDYCFHFYAAHLKMEYMLMKWQGDLEYQEHKLCIHLSPHVFHHKHMHYAKNLIYL